MSSSPSREDASGAGNGRRGHKDAPELSPAEFWERRYAGSGSDAVWSGHANQAMVYAVSELTPGNALDLGCGEGGDAIWLAQRGWSVTGIDISPTAIERASAAALDLGLGPRRCQFVADDLAQWRTDETFDLVTSSFMHSPVEFDRGEILRKAAGRVRPGGHLLVVSHGTTPPWSAAARHRPHAAEDPMSGLVLDPDLWTTVLDERHPRHVAGPDGQQAIIDDVILLFQRR